jgi:ATP-dependent DNA helicase RecQ
MKADVSRPSTGKAARIPVPGATGAPVDDELLACLRQWRKQTAARQGVPAFVVMHDTTLEAVCRSRPSTAAELRAVAGIGERKLEIYGHGILQAIARFESGVKPPERPAPLSPPAVQTLRLLRAGCSLEEIAATRKVTTGTVAETVSKLLEQGEFELQPGVIADEKISAIEKACAQLGSERLRPIKDALPEEVTFDEIRIVVADLKRRSAKTGAATT